MANEDSLYLSGLLRKKMLRHYLNYIVDYNSLGLTLANPKTWHSFNFSYEGEIQVEANNRSFKEQLRKLQELRIKEGINEILTLVNLKYGTNKWNLNGQMVNIQGEVKNIINLILKDQERKYAFNLLTCLNKIIINSTPLTIKDDLTNLTDLINFLAQEGDLYNQIEIDLIINKFLHDKFLVADTIRYGLPQIKMQNFKIAESDLDMAMQNVLLLGEFVAPYKVSQIAPYLLKQDKKTLIAAQIYFLTQSNLVRENFFWLLQHEEFSEEAIIHYLENNRDIPVKIKALIRQKNDLDSH